MRGLRNITERHKDERCAICDNWNGEPQFQRRRRASLPQITTPMTETTGKSRVLLDTMATLIDQHEKLETRVNRTALTVSAGLVGLPALLASRPSHLSIPTVVVVASSLFALAAVTVLFLIKNTNRTAWLQRSIVSVQTALGFYTNGMYRDQETIDNTPDHINHDLPNDHPLRGTRLFEQSGMQWGTGSWLQTRSLYIIAVFISAIAGISITLTLLGSPPAQN